MEKKIYLKIISFRLITCFIILFFLFGCTEKQKAEKEPTFKK